MKRMLFLAVLLCLTSNSLSAQEAVSLLSVLQDIEQSQMEYSIDIVSDGLEGLTTKAKVDGLDALTAVKQACKGLPVKVKVNGQHIYVQHERQKNVRKLKLNCTVQDIRAHKDLLRANVELLRPDSTVIEQKEAYRKHIAETFSWKTSEVSFIVPAKPAKYLFRISLEGYQTAYVDYTLDRIGRREHERGLPPFYLYPAPKAKMMQEVTITASKVKFYYKGDTIIYNADAFILAEGSMLDALIRQLPGVELKSDGRIYHEGKFVDALLLNGKEFFRNDRKLMLENLPAYIVKDIAIYDKQTAENEWLGIKDESTQRHVIDVRLKKEYMIGWLANIEAGGGTSERYLARLFAMRHSDFSRFAIVANANNLDDDTKPGETGNWQRSNTSDLRKTERADMDFHVSDRNKRWEYHGNATINHQRTEGETRTVRQNFLSTGDTYDHSFSSRTGEELRLASSLDFIRNMKVVRWTISPNFNYHRFDHSSDLTSATFNVPVADVSRQLLDELYSPASSHISLRDTLVNRILQQGIGNGHVWDATFHTSAIIKIPYTNENLRLGAGINLSGREERLFDQQSVSYAETALQPTSSSSSFHHFRDNHPTRDGKAYINVGYNIPLGEGWRSIHATYRFEHTWQHHRSTLYLLEAPYNPPVGDEQAGNLQTPPAGGLQGALPSLTEYQQVMDRNNSFDSHSRESRHKLDINIGYKFNKASYGQIWTLLNGDINVHQQGLDYERGSIDTTLCRTAFTISMDDNTFLDFKGGHQIGLTLGIHTKLPDLENRVNLRDNTDPMNIRLGNPDLRMAVTPDVGAYFSYKMKRGWQRIQWAYQRTFNAIAMGYVYDTKTGVRTYRPDNVNGNWIFDASYSLHLDFGKDKKQNLDVPLNYSYSQNVDLVGTTVGTPPSLSTVHRQTLSLSPTFKADIDKHHFELTCQPTWERLTGTRTGFQDFSAFTCRTSLSAILKLPWKLDLSTDLSLYSRTGYTDNALNTNDLVWNGRLSRPVLKDKLVLMVDGFDILGQLSNVTRIINAQGRTETYTNVLPRYVLFHAVWRMNHQPMRKGEQKKE